MRIDHRLMSGTEIHTVRMSWVCPVMPVPVPAPSVAHPPKTETRIDGKREDKTESNGHKAGGGSRVFDDPSKHGGKHSGGNDKGDQGKGKGR